MIWLILTFYFFFIETVLPFENNPRDQFGQLCNATYSNEIAGASNFCFVPMKQNFSRQILDSLTFAQSKENEWIKEAQLDRVKRGLLSVAKQGIMGVALGAAGGGGGEAGEDGENSYLLEHFETDKQKVNEFSDANRDQNTLKDSLSEIEITNDVSFDGFEEFKNSDTRIEFSDSEGEEGIGTTERITFPDGVGLYIAMECYRGSNTEECGKLLDKAKTSKQKSCGKSMIPSAYTIGTGFLISKDALDKTRRKSLITRLCNKPTKYGNKYVPDGMAIAEIYDSEAHSAFFSDVGQFVNYLSSSYGVSITNEELNSFATIIEFSIPSLTSASSNNEKADRKKNDLSSNKDGSGEKRAKKQILLSLFEINVIRYALHIDSMRPEYISPFFMIDFMSLPEDYFVGNAQQAYDKFLFRYGTHYIHSAEFGGQILFENGRVDESESDRNEMAEEAWKEIQSAFGSSYQEGLSLSVPTSSLSVDLGGGIKKLKSKLDSNGERKNDFTNVDQFKQRNWTNIFLQSQGGNINIAKLITRLESNTGPTLTEWLRSIPRRPKASKMKMRPINELLDFNIRVLFNYQQANETCKRSPTVKCLHGTSIEEFQAQFNRRRKSLEFAIEIFRHKSASQFNDLEIEAGSPETCLFSVNTKSSLFPTYQEILSGVDIKVFIKIDEDYSPFHKSEEIFIIYHDGLWFSKKRNENYNFLRSFKTPKLKRFDGLNIIVIKNLIFEYNEKTGDLIFLEIGDQLQSHSSLLNHKEVSGIASQLDTNWGDNGFLRNTRIAKASYVNILQGIEKAAKNRFFIMPCNLDWSTANSRKFTVTLKHGKCLRFIASSYGDIFVVFATNPHNEWTWYFVQISSYGVALYKTKFQPCKLIHLHKAGRVIKYNLNPSAGSLKDSDLFRRYFICMNYEPRHKLSQQQKRDDTESFYFKPDEEIDQMGLKIQYGTIDGYDSKEQVHLSFYDQNPLELRYYMFGSYDSKVSVYDISVQELTADQEASLRCSQRNMTSFDMDRCRQLCHSNCIGCFKANSTVSCIGCRFGEYREGHNTVCLDTCPKGFEKNVFLNKCQDIDECGRIDKFVVYKGAFKEELYSWKQCSAVGARCINEHASYRCECLAGFVGDGYECHDVDECQLNVVHDYQLGCVENSRCINLLGSYRCECREGFEAKNGTCVDKNECHLDVHECQKNSHCVNTIGSYRCNCNQGFSGNGLFCQDINECELKVSNCMRNAVCVNTIGSYRCDCLSGFFLRNNSCIRHTDSINFIIKEYLKSIERSKKIKRKNEATCFRSEGRVETPAVLEYCQFKNNCHRHALCLYDPKRRNYSCRCLTGYIGNGFICYDERFYFEIGGNICRQLRSGQTVCSTSVVV